ncbi:TIR domain-containing protein [Planococcus sp. S3-L1]|uniref:TIR domain-containing protein n=1 Tax=Planococcus sp. S3-L1 TaxID=3046200 RepID=UPI0024B8F726|nr:TIR domain-containing protein [Planococcus sp. S3-L1]MDJ0333544.1 TIR domain-containing protein [Planococcus sp. S3-L1]
MAKRAFFSFHYQRDIWRTNVVRNSGVVIGSSAAGFHDASLWEKAKEKGDTAIKNLIDEGLKNTSVTVVLIGAKSAGRKYINYEIEESIKRGNGILGIHINNIKNREGEIDIKGAVPAKLLANGYKVYNWPFDSEKFSKWVEEAYTAAN